MKVSRGNGSSNRVTGGNFLGRGRWWRSPPPPGLTPPTGGNAPCADTHTPTFTHTQTAAPTTWMGDTSQEWQAVGDVAVGDMVGSYDPMTGRWMCGRYDACRAIQATSLRPWDGEQMALPSELSGTVKRYTQLAGPAGATRPSVSGTFYYH